MNFNNSDELFQEKMEYLGETFVAKNLKSPTTMIALQ